MEDPIFGVLAITAGALFCFRGYPAFRIIIPLWAAFVGFSFGAGVTESITDEGFLQTGVAWLVGLGAALLFALLAYLSYEIAVVLAMGSIGFALGTSLMVALDISWTWAIALVGMATGGLLAVAAIVAELSRVLLVALSAMGGASAITAGMMLVVGAVDTGDFGDGSVTARAADDWWWYMLYSVLAALGVVAQLRATEHLPESWGAGRAAW